MKSINVGVFSFLTILIFLFSCSKEDDEVIATPSPAGKGGLAIITGHVKHHDDAIPNAMVYVKYNTTELPGVNPGDYDDSTMASDDDAHYTFEGLQIGNYYVLGIGYDSSCTCQVFGGRPVVISNATEIADADVPVTE